MGERSGTYLILRIRPSITIMQIQINAHPRILHPLRELNIILQIVDPVGWVDPYALPDGVGAVVCEDGFQRLRFSGEVFVGCAGFF